MRIFDPFEENTKTNSVNEMHGVVGSIRKEGKNGGLRNRFFFSFFGFFFDFVRF